MSDIPSVNPPESSASLSMAERLLRASNAARAAWRPTYTKKPAPSGLPQAQAPVHRPPVAFHPARPAVVVRPAAAVTTYAPRPRLGSRQPPMDLFKPAPVVKAKAAAKAKSMKTTRTPEEVRRRLFKQLDITTLGQILLCVPSFYVDCVNMTEMLFGAVDGTRSLFYLKRTGRIEAVDEHKRLISAAPHGSLFEAPWHTHWRRIRMLRIELEDVHGQIIWLSSFNPWQWKDSDPLGKILIEGTVETFGARRMLLNTSEPPPDVAGKVWARYSSGSGAKEEDVRQAVLEALDDPESFQQAAHSLISSTLLSEKQLLELAQKITDPFEDLRDFFLSLHSPSDTLEGELAADVARLMGVVGVCNAAKATSMRYPHSKAAINISDAQVRAAVASQSETLTGDQVVVIDQLVEALRSPLPLNGLLSGDVGTGKTLAYLIPSVAVHRAGGQVALISPTEILANQLAANLQRRFPDAAVERVLAGGKIRNPQAILVGTSGLATVAKKANYFPNLLVVDEQHKLATKDRNSMVGPWTHHLEASATPIPRSLAATMFNGTQVFNLNEAPVARQIESYVFDEGNRSQVAAWMRQALDGQQRVAVIYPRVEKVSEKLSAEDASYAGAYTPDNHNDTEDHYMPEYEHQPPPLTETTPRKLPVASVTEAAQGLEQRFPGRVGMLHGKLSAAEISRTLDDFRSGARPIVVASTIMETGIDIPDIRLLIVKDADNFGAAQLHQLRGRLARNGGAARFVMMVSDCSKLAPETLDRLKMVSRTTDGFALAEADMENRGFGDLAGQAQSGNASSAFRLLKLNIADFVLRFSEQESPNPKE